MATHSLSFEREPGCERRELSARELKEAQDKVLEDTMGIAERKFAKLSREEQSALTARIVAIKP